MHILHSECIFYIIYSIPIPLDLDIYFCLHAERENSRVYIKIIL